jgi:hypothetical protein
MEGMECHRFPKLVYPRFGGGDGDRGNRSKAVDTRLVICVVVGEDYKVYSFGGGGGGGFDVDEEDEKVYYVVGPTHRPS